MWIKVATASDLPPGESRAVDAAGRRLALFNDAGEFHAIDDVCPHEGGSLSAGTLHEGRVICPLHSWVFELRTGRCPRDSHEPVHSYTTRCSAGSVEVEIPTESP